MSDSQSGADAVTTKPTLKLTEPELDPKKPWDTDALGRKPIADALTNLISDEPNSLVITLNGSWGSGKTFLLKRWAAQLNLDGHKAIYFSAWESDHCGDPIVVLLGEMWALLKGSDAEEVVKSFKETAKSLFTDTVFNTVRSGTLGIVDLDTEELKSIAEKAIDAYASEQASKEELKRRLSRLASEVANEDTRDGENDSADEETRCPLVFIIDELDRCRPTYAIELLERIKHIFSIPNMVFVLGIDRIQLASSIKAVYGTVDVEGYLRRFFDMEFALPPVDIATYCKHLLERHNLKSFFQARKERADENKHLNDFEVFSESFPRLCKRFSLSLRDMEHLIRVFVFTGKNLGERDLLYPDLLSVLLLLRIKNRSLYQEYTQGSRPACEVLNWFAEYFEGTQGDREATRDWDQLEVTVYLSALETSRHGNAIGEQLKLLADQESLTRSAILSDRTKSLVGEAAEALFGRYQDQIGNYGSPTRDTFYHLVSKIELASQLVKK